MRIHLTPRLLIAPVLVLVIAALVTNVAASEDGSIEIVRVEETWELAVGQPNADRNAPQVTMVMSPYADLDGEYFVFTLNHRNHPTYQAGGTQIAVFDDETLEDYRSGPKEDALDHTSETIQWTQALAISSGDVTFEVKSGTSSTWGAFGGEGYLRDSINVSQTNLNSYHPAISISESEIGFAGNRVVSLTLLKIKWYLSDGRVYERNAPIDIHSDLDPWNDEE